MPGRIVGHYDYTTRTGEPRIRKVRFEPKQFRMKSYGRNRQVDPAWLPGIRDNRLAFALTALFRLPEVVAGIRAGAEIALTEGERDALALSGLGVVATSHWQGASAFELGQARRLRKATRIAVVCDVDDAGAFSGILRRDALLEVGVPERRIRLVAPPRPFGDAAEAVEAGRSWGAFRSPDLRAVERAARRYAQTRAAHRESSDWMKS